MKFGVGPVSWYQSIRLSDSYHYLIYLMILNVYISMTMPLYADFKEYLGYLPSNGKVSELGDFEFSYELGK